MARTYNSARRKEAARQTRTAILRAAQKLHWEGITEFEPLAEEVGCSLATVRKHYPTKESLFGECTQDFLQQASMPDPAAVANIKNPDERTAFGVAELCRLHEMMFGYTWHSSYLRKDSPTLDAVMKNYEELTDALVDAMFHGPFPARATVRGLVDFLSYRALRLPGGLSPEKAKDELQRIVRLLTTETTGKPAQT